MNSTNENPIHIDEDIQTSSGNESVLTDNSLGKISKNKTDLEVATSIYYKGSYHVTLKDCNTHSGISDKTLNLVINKVNYIAKTNSNGVASVNLKLNPGKYSSSVYFEGDDSYQSENISSDFKVLPIIKASDLSKYYKGTKKFSATFLSSNGDYLKNRAVNIKINGKSYTRKTNAKGFVSIPVNLKPGAYKIISTDPITGYKLTTTFKVLSTITSSSINKVAGDSKKFTAKFFKSNGKSLSKKYVKIKVNGKIHKVKTNNNGKATLSLKKLKVGTYKVVCYNNDGLSKTFKVNVFKRKASTTLTTKDYTFTPNDKREIRIKFTTALKDDSNSARTIKITINGKTYSKKTDGNGIIDFKLPSLNKGIYKVQCKYGGNTFFKAAKSTNYVTLLKDTSTTKLTVTGTISFGCGAGTLLKVKYSADDVPLAKKTVIFTIDGEIYEDITDYNGIASVPINLQIGKHTINFKTNKDSIVNGTSGFCDINVFKRAQSNVTWKCGVSYKDNLQIFKVLVTDSNGKAVSGGNIELVIDGKTYESTVSSNGYATFETCVALGKYNVSVKFLGNNAFDVSSTSRSINVTLSKFANGLNQKNPASLKAYLKSSSHCKVGSPTIKALVKSLTKGLTNDVDKAKAIFNYVRDTLDYSFYYNSKYGAAKTLELKKGNCVDHSHLLVAMYRTMGFQARYVHGICHFIKSGHTTGHVWVQVNIDKTWVCADATSYRNSLGKIANWDTKSYSIHAKYASLPF